MAPPGPTWLHLAPPHIHPQVRIEQPPCLLCCLCGGLWIGPAPVWGHILAHQQIDYMSYSSNVSIIATDSTMPWMNVGLVELLSHSHPRP